MQVVTYGNKYRNKQSKQIVTAIAYNEITPNDLLLNHGIMPLVEYLDCNKEWHIISLEGFLNEFEEA